MRTDDLERPIEEPQGLGDVWEQGSEISAFMTSDGNGDQWVTITANKAGFRTLARLFLWFSDLDVASGEYLPADSGQYAFHLDRYNFLGNDSDARLIIWWPPSGAYTREWAIKMGLDLPREFLLHTLLRGSRNYRDAALALRRQLSRFQRRFGTRYGVGRFDRLVADLVSKGLLKCWQATSDGRKEVEAPPKHLSRADDIWLELTELGNKLAEETDDNLPPEFRFTSGT